MIVSKTICLRRQSAFTLVELLVVLAVMMLMLKLTLPSLKGLLGSTPERILVRQLVGDINKARLHALKNGRPVYVVFMPKVSSVINQPNKTYFTGEMAPASPGKTANELVGQQCVAYALYAEYMPGDQPNSPSRRWLTNWKILPDGYHFHPNNLDDIRINHFGGPLSLRNLKNEHAPTYLNNLPFIKFNAKGQLEKQGGYADIVPQVKLQIYEGGVFQPTKEKVNGRFKLEDADLPPDNGNRQPIEILIRGRSGRAESKEY